MWAGRGVKQNRGVCRRITYNLRHDMGVDFYTLGHILCFVELVEKKSPLGKEHRAAGTHMQHEQGPRDLMDAVMDEFYRTDVASTTHSVSLLPQPPSQEQVHTMRPPKMETGPQDVQVSPRRVDSEGWRRAVSLLFQRPR